MGRRRTTVLDESLELISRLPWWAGVAGALVSFLVMRAIVGMDLAAGVNPRDMSGLMTRVMVGGLATAGQWILPLVFLGGAVFSYVKQRKRSQLHADAVAQRGTAGVATMSWQDFERLVGEYFRRRGFAVSETGGGGADGGVDLVATKGKDRYLVQCKHWRAMTVGVVPVRELYGVMAANRAAGAFMVTSGSFTEEAKGFAEGRELQLVDGKALVHEMRKQAGTSVPPRAPVVSAVEPSCPTCSATMVLRRARTGSRAGQAFWGCSTYPACRGTRAAHE
jgi:restriction system protein